MNAVDMAQRAYGVNAAPVRTNRSTEYAVFSRITHNLKSAAKSGQSGFADLAGALHDNRRLWSILASEVSQDANALPVDLRAQIFYLAEYVNSHSRRVLKGEASADALLEINTAIMRGLAERGSAQ